MKRIIPAFIGGYLIGSAIHINKRSGEEDEEYDSNFLTCFGQPIPLANLPFLDSSKSMKKNVLETGSSILQRFTPIKEIHTHVCGFHCYSGELDRQVIAHHYCSHLSDDLAQCVIYDSDGPKAKLIGIEYIVSEKVFSSFPEEEKKLWHSHVYEVISGELIAPRIPDVAEHAFMKDLVRTYGKTFHTWQIDRGDPFPYGIPNLMMAFTSDGQLNDKLVQERDDHYGISTEERRKSREDIDLPQIDPLADYWMKTGRATKLISREVSSVVPRSPKKS